MLMGKYLFLLLSIIFFKAEAQNTLNKKAKEYFETAQKYFIKQQYSNGIESLKSAIKADPEFQDAYVLLGDAYRKIKQYAEAKSSYQKVISLNNNVLPRVYFGLAEAEEASGDYTLAKQHFQYYITKNAAKDIEGEKRAKKNISDCDFAIEAIKHPVKFNPLNIGKEINSANQEYFPSLTADDQTIIFTRQINGNEDFYVSSKKNSIWQEAVPLSNNINTTQYNEGAQSISPDGNYLFFTGCNRPEGLGRCDIYVSHKEGNDWSEPYNLGAPVNSEYWDSQPAVSPDGNTLYFVSNRPGGFGGYDVWKSTVKDGKWSEPENLGPEINTEYDENTPFLHADGRSLYFSSNGWPSFGDKDIYLSRLSDANKWQKPINLGYPINTFNEENGLIISADGTTGMFSSNNKNGFGGKDIYYFDIPESIKPLPVTYVKGSIKDKGTKEALEGYVQVINLKNNKAVFNDYSNTATGNFLAVMPLGSNYLFNVTANGYLFFSENFELKTGSFEKPFEIEILLEKIKPGANMVLKNIFFDTNKYDLLPPSITELGILINFLNENPGVNIEIQGHTDNIGDIAFNQKLSENRAEAVFNHLKEHKIDTKRLVYNGYGESKPIATNNTAEGRKQNRRTSFVITKI